MKQEALMNYRTKKRLTHEQVAEKSGITRQYYGMIENGDRDPSVEVAKRIAAVLEFNWIIFFENTGNDSFPFVGPATDDSNSDIGKEVG